MAGGIYSSMNKVRPGAYINFQSNEDEGMILGTRGIATFATELDWGADDKLIEVSANDLLTGNSLAKIGLVSTDSDALPFNLALQNCSKLKIYKLNKGGSKANATLSSGLKITAKYNGTFGNKIAILVKSLEDGYDVQTYADGYYVDNQKVTSISQLVDNDFVTFSGSGDLQPTASTLLTGGTNNQVSSLTTAYEEYFKLLRTSRWQTLAIPVNEAEIITAVKSFIVEMRENEGKYVQVVIANDETANYEGIVNNANGVVLEDGKTISAVDFTVWVAGAIAGAALTESLTGKVIPNAAEIVNPLTSDEIIDGLNAGKFILSLNQNGSIKVEKDINSLHTFTPEKSAMFSKNRIIRELDEIGSSIEDIWENTYLGKVSNTSDGRTLFRASIINYLTDLQNQGVISNFDSSSVNVEAGSDLDVVIASIAIKPVDSMEILYMTVNVQK